MGVAITDLQVGMMYLLSMRLLASDMSFLKCEFHGDKGPIRHNIEKFVVYGAGC